MTYEFDPDWPDSVPAEEEAASVGSLALAPRVEERARSIREAHLSQRRAESEVAAATKIHKWRRGETRPQGGRHT